MKWAAPCASDEDSVSNVIEELGDVDEGGELNGGNEDGDRIQTQVVSTKMTSMTHHVAKTQLVTITSIVNDFGASDFLMHFNVFLQKNSSPYHRDKFNPYSNL